MCLFEERMRGSTCIKFILFESLMKNRCIKRYLPGVKTLFTGDANHLHSCVEWGELSLQPRHVRGNTPVSLFHSPKIQILTNLPFLSPKMSNIRISSNRNSLCMSFLRLIQNVVIFWSRLFASMWVRRPRRTSFRSVLVMRKHVNE